MGVNDIIIDPGFGFSKTLDDNYLLMNGLSEFQVLGFPVLAGISRALRLRYLGIQKWRGEVRHSGKAQVICILFR